MATINALIKHAITAPKFDRGKIHRERLVDAIHANVPRKLIVIAAPAGYGKTTILADFTACTDLPVCWLRLTDADRDVMRLATVLAASLQRRFRRLRGKLDFEILAGASPEAIAHAFVETIDDNVSETFVIAIDDVHLINHSKPVLRFFDAFLDEQPDQVTMIAAGREVLEVSLARLMADGDLEGFGPHDLALTRDELEALTHIVLNKNLQTAEIDHLMKQTRGWITGVLLSGMLSGSSLRSMIGQTGPMVYEYLASVVLNRQPDDIRRFMLDSAVLPVMTAADCDQVLKRKDSQRYLSRILREGLFITTTDISPRTYEYHPQFRQFLLDLLSAADNKRLRSLRIRAAVYLEEAGSIDKAVELYLDAGANHRAAILAEKHAQGMFYQGRVQTLKDWGLRLKESNMAAPKAFLYIAKSYTDQGELEQAKASLHEADRMIGKKTPKGVLAKLGIQRGMIAVRQRDYDAAWKAAKRAEKLSVGPGSRQNRAASLRLKALTIYYQRGDLGKAERLVKEGAKLMAESVYRYDLAMIFADIMLIQVALGKSLEAYAASQRAHEILLEVGSPLPLAASYNNLAYGAYLQGKYEIALTLFGKGFKSARQAASPARELMILYGQADLFNDLGLAFQAAELYEQGLTLATRLNNNDMIQYGCLQTSVLHRRQGSGNLPHQWLQRAVSLSSSSQMSDAARIQLAALEMAASPENAKATLMDILSKESKLDAGERTLVFYFLAKADIADGDRDTARKLLEKTLDWVGGHGSEQILAAEMLADEKFQEFAEQSLPGHPVLSVVINRIETMQAVAKQYKKVGEEPPADTRLVVKALGEISLERFGVSLPDLRPLAREVLVYLVDNHRVDRDVLLETFWPKYSPGRQVSNLYTAIYSLRRVLGKGAIVLDGSVYSINPEMAVEYDVARFERAASIAESLPPGDPRRPFALTEAINSYGGNFLEELSSDWVLERRRILETRYLELLIVHADEALIRDQPLKAVNSLRRALEIDPCRDDVNLTYLEALGRLERRSEIVAHYQRYVRLLSDELGLDPPESVRKLYTRLLG